MIKLETLNELTLKVSCDGAGELYTKMGAFVGGESYGGRNYTFDKVLFGPQNNIGQAIVGQVMRRFTGENLPLTKVVFQGQSVTYYANEAQHVTVINLRPGETLSVESENILAFCDCDYSVRFLAQGVISQKGLATSTLRGRSNYSQAAVLTDGNPIAISNMQNGSVLTADPDALVCWVGQDPTINLNVSWKNLIGQASGESYMFEFKGASTIIIQPNERTSGIDIGMDGKGGKPNMQQNNLFRQGGNQAVQSMGNMMGNMMNGGNNGHGGPSGNNGLGGLGGLGNLLGGIINS